MNFFPNKFQLLAAKIHTLVQTTTKKSQQIKEKTLLFGCKLTLSPILHKSAVDVLILEQYLKN